MILLINSSKWAQLMNGGKRFWSFRWLTGDAETTTDPGIYLVRMKQVDYYSRKYRPPCLTPYFSLYNENSDSRRGSTTAAEKKIGLATHGFACTCSSPTSSGYMIGRRPAVPWWFSWAGERRIKDSYQFRFSSFRLKAHRQNSH